MQIERLVVFNLWSPITTKCNVSMTSLIPTIKPPFELVLKIFRVSHIANILKSTREMFPVFSQQCAMPVIQNKNNHKLVAGLQTTSQHQSSNPPSFHWQGRRPKTYLEGFHEPWLANTYTDKAPLLRTLTKQISSQVASFLFLSKKKENRKKLSRHGQQEITNLCSNKQ